MLRRAVALTVLGLAACAALPEPVADDLTPVKAEVYLATLKALAREHPDDILWLRNGSKRALQPFMVLSPFSSISHELYVIWMRMEEERDDWQAFSAAMRAWRPKFRSGGQGLDFLLSPVILSQDRQRAAVVCGIQGTYRLAVLGRKNGSWETTLEINPVIF